MTPGLAGQVVVVTGASSGTGAGAARRFHRLGAQVVVVGRDRDRTRAVAEDIGASWHTADFADLAQVRVLAERLGSELPRIDVLADNAGGAVRSTARTVDGHEPNHQVNALAPFLLISLLLPALAAGRGRVVSTSSRSHRGADLTAGTDLDDVTGLGPHHRYARAKLVALLLHRELTRRHPQLTVVDFHPGIVASGFGRYLPAGDLLTRLARPFLASPETAGGHLVHLAEIDVPAGSHYFHVRRPRDPSPLAADPDLARVVFADACRRLGRSNAPESTSREER